MASHVSISAPDTSSARNDQVMWSYGTEADDPGERVQGEVPRAARRGRADERDPRRDEARQGRRPGCAGRRAAEPSRHGGVPRRRRDADQAAPRGLGTRLAGLVVLDTHVWLWWVDLPRRLSGTATRTIEAAERVGVAAMSVLELAELFERGRIRADVSSRAWVRAALATVEPLALTPEIALDAAQLRFVNDPFDRVIYATARVEGAKLVTRDDRIRAFDPSIALW